MCRLRSQTGVLEWSVARTVSSVPIWFDVVSRYVTQEGRSTVVDGSGAVRSLVQCGTTAGHISSGFEPGALEPAADLRFLSWGGQDLNLRPTDYESAALTN